MHAPQASLALSTRNGLIDLLRGWAVLAVVLLHIQIRVPFTHSDLAGWLLALGFVLMALVLYFRGWTFKLGLPALGLDMSVLGLGTALVLVVCHSRPDWEGYADSLPGRVLQWFGRHGYEVYLSHMFVVLVLVALLPAEGLVAAWVAPFYLLTVVLCGWLGHALAQYFSAPLNKRIRRGWQSRPASVVLASGEASNG